MLQLPAPEMALFMVAGLLYGGAAVVGLIQLSARWQASGRLLVPLVCLGICLQSLILVFRAASIKAIPLTGLFESMLVLTIVLGLLYVFLSIGIRQVWFGSIMAWTIMVLLVLAAVVAKPATVPTKVAVTPWMVFHAIAMVLSSVAIAFSTATAALYLLGDHKLKERKVMSVLGYVPNMEWLRHANKLGLTYCFVTMTAGLAFGIGLAVMESASMGMIWSDWILDPKIVLIAVTWFSLVAILSLHSFAGLSDKAMGYATLLLFFLILFAVVGVTLFCGTKHVFT